MSDTQNHLLCGSYSLPQLNEIFQSCIEEHLSLYRLGCLGPDLFFYYNFMPYENDGGVNKYGSMLHKTNPDILFNLAAIYIRTLEGKSRNAALAYVVGYIAHYVLDSITHPYVIHFAAEYDKNRPETRCYKHTHKRLEILLDILNFEKENKSFFDLKPLSFFSAIEIEAVSGLYDKWFSVLFHMQVPRQIIEKSAKDLYRLQKFSQSAGKVKYKLFKKLEKQPFSFTRICPYISEEERNLDIMNEQHRMWQHPFDPEVFCNYSYSELFHQAVRAFPLKANAFYNFLLKENTALDLFEGKGFDIGVRSENASPASGMTCVFDPLWKGNISQ